MKYLLLSFLLGGLLSCNSGPTAKIAYKGLFDHDTVIVLRKPLYIKSIEIKAPTIYRYWFSGGYLSFINADSGDIAHWKAADHEVVVITYYPETGKTDTGVFYTGDTIRFTSCDVPEQVKPIIFSASVKNTKQ